MEFGCTVERSGGQVLVTPAGDIDLNTTADLRKALQEAVATPDLSGIEVDLRHVNYLDSTGLGVFVAAYKAAAEKGATLRLREPQPIVRMVLEVTNLLDLLVAGGDGPTQVDREADGEAPG